MVKRILVGLVVLVLIVGAGAYFLGANLDSVVQSAIEKYGTAAAGATVKLEEVKIVLARGEASLKGLSVGDPPGFPSEKSLYLGSISVSLDTHSLSGGGPIIIRDISIEKPQIVYEVDNRGQSNLQALMRNTQAYAESFGSRTKKSSANTGSDSGQNKPERKMIIENLTVRDGQISFSQALLQGKQISAKLPVIHLTNIGKDEQGATPAEVAQQVLGAITENASEIASADLAKELGSTLTGKTGNEAIGNAVNGIGGQLKGLLGK